MDDDLFNTMIVFAFLAGACAFVVDFSRSMQRAEEEKARPDS